jgi:enterochelin esterase-like enzyme
MLSICTESAAVGRGLPVRFAEICAEFDAVDPSRSAEAPGQISSASADGTSSSFDQERQFWEEIARRGTPLVDPCPDDSALRDVTFLFRADDPEVRSVRLVANRVTDKDRQADGLMSRVPGTGIWGVTLSLPADLRCSYGFSPSTDEVAPPLGGPGRPGPPVLIDPYNPDPPLTRPDQSGDGVGSSVFSGPLAPDHGVWNLGTESSAEAAPALKVTGTNPDNDGGEGPGTSPGAGLFISGDREIACESYPVRVSLPATPPAGLLVLFDGRQWFDHLGVDRAVAAAGLPGLIIIGIGTRSTAERIHTLAGNDGFLRSVAEELVPEIEAEAAAHGSVLPAEARRMICGQSLGGLSALHMAHACPGAFDAVLAHSPSLWWSPGGTATPADLASMDGDDWTARRFLDADGGAQSCDGADAGSTVGVASDGSIVTAGISTSGGKPSSCEFHLAVGRREGPMVDRATRLVEVLDGLGHRASLSVYEGGHDYACWRGELIDGLRKVFASNADASAQE